MRLNKLSDTELIEIVEESNQQFISSDAKVRAIAIEEFGNDSLISILGVQAAIAPILAERLKFQIKKPQ